MSMPPNPRTSYDELPYPSHPYPYTHPDHLGAVATILGLRPAPADRCRVLELGCAGGGNLIPLAYAYPESTFIGVDLSIEQIREAEGLRKALGLTNVDLRAMSILEVDDRFGFFDFIICHGVYSWVPQAVQEKILEICAVHLSPEGIGFVSYNTYPGWHMRGMIRALMGFHDRRFGEETPLKRVAQARALLTFLAEAVPQENSPYSLLLREHLELLGQCSDPYLFHEHLEECNEPVYFMEFCERLAEHGLRYLGESEFRMMVPSTSFPPEVQDRLKAVAPTFLEMEQYMDFLRNRMFRQTLVCRGNLRPNYEVRAERLFDLQLASPVRPASDSPDLSSDSPEEFIASDGSSVTTPTPIVKAALVHLGERWPASVAFDTLLARARTKVVDPLREDSASDDQNLGTALLTAYAKVGRKVVELSVRPPAFSAEVSERPVASSLVRFQAQTMTRVTNLRHEVVQLSPFDVELVRLLDGTRDRTALVEALVEVVRLGRLKVFDGDQPVDDITRVRLIVEEILDQRLPRLAKTALLTA
jgi:methyltransferase-like protein/2-polyprenyl-3-methyl-5-hydroxy-6-metoxy-1,4-benzoquinol methylase